MLTSPHFKKEGGCSIWKKGKHHKWEHSLLSKESVDFLNKLPYRIDEVGEGYNLSIMHYCMDDEGHYINYIANPSEDDLKMMFGDVRSDIILYRHDHRRNIHKGDKLYINVGSLGCPSQDKNVARTGVVKIEKGNIEVEPIDVEYDVNEVIKLIDEINYPAADDIKNFSMEFDKKQKLSVYVLECDKLRFNYSEFAIIRRVTNLNCYKK